MLKWRVWPAAQRPVLSVAVAVFALFLSAVAIAVFGSPWYGFIALLVLGLTLAPHYFPTDYILDNEKIVMRGGAGNAERRWEVFRLAVDEGDRIFLSPLSDHQRWLARRRGLTLRLADNHDRVWAYVTRRIAQNEAQRVD